MFNYIPGFRSKTKWKMIVAGLYYLLSLSALTSGFGVFLVAISLPFMLINIYKGVKTKDKKVLTTGITAAVIFFIGAGLTPTQSVKDTSAKTEAKTSQTPVEKPKQAESPAFENGAITNDTVKTALSKVHDTNVIDINSNDFKSIDVVGYVGDNANDNTGKVITITVKPKQIWDETDLAKKAASSMANYCEVLSKNKNVRRVSLVILADFKDNYGNSSENNALWLKWDRNTLDKVNYKEFENMLYGDYTKAYQISDSYNFSYGIYSKLKNLNGLPVSK